MEGLQQLYCKWRDAVSKGDKQVANDVLVAAKTSIPNDKVKGRWAWFKNALEEGGDQSDFAMAALGQHSIPKALLSDILTAAFRFSDASTIRFYIEPCIKTYGMKVVDEKLLALSGEFEDGWEKYQMAQYWYPAIKPK